MNKRMMMGCFCMIVATSLIVARFCIGYHWRAANMTSDEIALNAITGWWIDIGMLLFIFGLGSKFTKQHTALVAWTLWDAVRLEPGLTAPDAYKADVLQTARTLTQEAIR